MREWYDNEKRMCMISLHRKIYDVNIGHIEFSKTSHFRAQK